MTTLLLNTAIDAGAVWARHAAPIRNPESMRAVRDIETKNGDAAGIERYLAGAPFKTAFAGANNYLPLRAFSAGRGVLQYAPYSSRTSSTIIEQASEALRTFSDYRHDIKSAIFGIDLRLRDPKKGITDIGSLQKLREMLEGSKMNIPDRKIKIEDEEQAREILFLCELFIDQFVGWNNENDADSIFAGLSVPENINQNRVLVIKEDIMHVKDMVAKLQAFLEDKTESIQREKIDISQLIRQSVEMLGIEVELVLDADPLYVTGDKVLLKRVLVDLLKNAIDAMAGAEVPRLMVSARKTSEDYAEIMIRDNGIGIPPDKLRQIFDRYFTTKGDEGTGLGLAIAKEIVEVRLGGTITVSSELGKGTTFTVRLPIAKTSAATLRYPAPQPAVNWHNLKTSKPHARWREA